MVRNPLGNEQHGAEPFLSAGKAAATTLWEQPVPCVFGQKEPFVPIILLLNAIIWSHCDLLVSCFLPTGSPLPFWVATRMAVPRGDNRQRSRSIQYRLSRGRVTSSSAETLTTKKKTLQMVQEGDQDFPSGCSRADKQCCGPPNMSTSCPPVQKIIDCQ